LLAAKANSDEEVAEIIAAQNSRAEMDEFQNRMAEEVFRHRR
jgi:hypothetical protein